MKTHKRKAIIFAVCIVAVAFIASFLLIQIKDHKGVQSSVDLSRLEYKTSMCSSLR